MIQNRFFIGRILCFVALLLIPVCGHADAVSNGGFENPVISGSNTVYAAGSGGLTDWTITGSSGVDHVRTLWSHAEGTQSISLNWAAPSTIAQTISTDVGQIYQLELWLAAESPAANSTIRSVDVFWGGGLVDSLSFDPAGKTNSSMGWQYYSYNVSGTGSDTLSFASTTSGAFGPALDGISLMVIPEPSYALCWLFIAVATMALNRFRPVVPSSLN